MRATGKTVNFFIVRHGHTTYNGSNLFQGHWKPTLDEKGKEQSSRIADFFLKHHGSEGIIIFSSDAKRAVQTTEIIAQRIIRADGNILDVKYDERLRERHVGDRLDGKPIPPGVSERQIDEYVTRNGGEPMARVWKRAGDFLCGLWDNVEEYAGRNVMAVTHEFVIKAIVGISNGQEMRIAFQELSFANGSITRGKVSEGGVEIIELNYVAHLKLPDSPGFGETMPAVSSGRHQPQLKTAFGEK